MTEKFVTVANGRFRYLDFAPETKGGTLKGTLLLVHGFGQTCHSYDEFSPVIAKDGYRVVAIDLRGHGLSHRSPTADYSRTSMAEDIVQICHAINLKDFVIVGQSMGGALSTFISSQEEERSEEEKLGIRGLIAVDWAPWGENTPTGVTKIVGLFHIQFKTFEEAVEQTMMFNPRRTRENIEHRLKHSLRHDKERDIWVWNTDPNIEKDAQRRSKESPGVMWDVASKVRCGALVVKGEVSDILNTERAEKLANLFRENNKGTNNNVSIVPNMVVVEGAGHSVVGDQPERFYQAVHKFIAACFQNVSNL